MRRADDTTAGRRPRLRARVGARLTGRRRFALPSGVAAFVIAVISTLAALDPRSAVAQQQDDDGGGLVPGVPDPGDLVEEAADAIGGAVSSAAVDMMREILEWIFGGIQTQITTSLLTWLTSIPNFTGGNVGQLANTTTAIAWGLVAVVLTVAVARYWMAGMSSSGQGGAEIMDAFTRVVGAVLFVAIWPLLFRSLVALSNAAAWEMLHADSVQDDLTRLLRAAIVANFAGGAIGPIVGIITAIVGTLLLLALVAMKIVVTASTVLLFVGMPLAVILWPITETSWLARAAGKALVVCLLIPLIWAAIFAAFAAVTMDALTFKGGDGLLDKALIKPLTGLALLYVCVQSPRWLMKAAMMGAHGPGGGFLARTSSYMAARHLSQAASQQIPQQLGGMKTPAATPAPTAATPTQRATPAAGGAAVGPGAAAAGAGGPASLAADAAASKAASGATSTNGATKPAAAPTPPPQPTGPNVAKPSPAPVARSGANGAQTPGTANTTRSPYSPAKYAAARREVEAMRANTPPSAAQVSAAYSTIIGQQRHMLDTLRGQGAAPERQMSHLTNEASHATGEQHAALTTLAAAEADVRDAGIATAQRSPTQDSGPSTPTSARVVEQQAAATDPGAPAAPLAPSPAPAPAPAPSSAPWAPSGPSSGGLGGGTGRPPAAPPSGDEKVIPPSPAISPDSGNPFI